MDSEFRYEYENDEFYCYPNSSVLKNKLNITDEKELGEVEREISFLRSAELDSKPLAGDLDFDYLERIHRYLFGDIYDWAGQIRVVDISKGNTFCLHDFIDMNAEAAMRGLKDEDYLIGRNKEEVARRLAYYLGEINTIHPFREGNGQAQRQFVREVAARIGYVLNFEGVSQKEMIEASNAAFYHEYRLMEGIIARCLSE